MNKFSGKEKRDGIEKISKKSNKSKRGYFK